MKNKMSLFVVMALAALIAVSGNVLASGDQDKAQEVIVEQGQAAVEKESQMAEEATQVTEETMKEEEKAAEKMMEEVKEEAMENTPQADK